MTSHTAVLANEWLFFYMSKLVLSIFDLYFEKDIIIIKHFNFDSSTDDCKQSFTIFVPVPVNNFTGNFRCMQFWILSYI